MVHNVKFPIKSRTQKWESNFSWSGQHMAGVGNRMPPKQNRRLFLELIIAKFRAKWNSQQERTGQDRTGQAKDACCRRHVGGTYAKHIWNGVSWSLLKQLPGWVGVQGQRGVKLQFSWVRVGKANKSRRTTGQQDNWITHAYHMSERECRSLRAWPLQTVCHSTRRSVVSVAMTQRWRWCGCCCWWCYMAVISRAARVSWPGQS